MLAPPLPCKCNLTVTEAHAYVDSRPLFEHLLKHCGLKSIWDGKGHKKVLYRVRDIDAAIDVLKLNGGWDDTDQTHLHKD